LQINVEPEGYSEMRPGQFNLAEPAGQFFSRRNYQPKNQPIAFATGCSVTLQIDSGSLK